MPVEQDPDEANMDSHDHIGEFKIIENMIQKLKLPKEVKKQTIGHHIVYRINLQHPLSIENINAIKVPLGWAIRHYGLSKLEEIGMKGNTLQIILTPNKR